jgi:hypothetical protein
MHTMLTGTRALKGLYRSLVFGAEATIGTELGQWESSVYEGLLNFTTAGPL